MSDQSLASIGIKIESTEADVAAQKLDKLVAAGDAADATVSKLAATSQATAAQLGTVGAAAQKLTQAQGATNETIKAATISSKQYAQSLRLLPIQIHQGFDQLLYGTNPLIVLSTQLPQISESFGGVGNAIKALGTLITPVSVGVTVLAVAIGTVGYAWYEAGAEQDAFTKKLITTGDAVGLTTDQLEAMAKQIENAGVSHGDAVSALMTVLSSGITENVSSIAKLAAQLQELGGGSIAQTVKEFASLGQDPVKAAESLQRSLAFLTPEVYDEIAALQKSGDTAAASALAQGQLSKALTEQVALLKEAEGGWSGIAQAVKNFASDAVSAIGQDLNPGLAGQIAALKQQILVAQSGAFTSIAGPASSAQITGLEARLQSLQALQAKLQAFANQGKANASGTQSAIDANAQGLLSAQQAGALQESSLFASSQLASIQRDLSANLATVQRYDALLDAEHSAHLISDQAYYSAKRRAIEADTQSEATALQAQIDALDKQSADVLAASQKFADTHSGPDAEAEQYKNLLETLSKYNSIQDQIADKKSQLSQLTAEQTQKEKLLGIERYSADKTALDTLNNLRASENQYLETLQRSYQLQLQGLQVGPTARQRLQDLSQVDARALEQRQQLDQAKRINPALPNYDAQLQAIEDAHKKALGDTDAYYRALDKAQADWLTGAKGAFATYEESAHDISGQVQNAFTDAFTGLEDVFVQFAQTGKLTFKSFADSVIGDIARILAKQEISSIAALFGFGASALGATGSGIISDLGATGSTVGFAAAGGNISGPTIVGEKGPELFVPDTSGYVVPNDKLAAMAGSGPSVNITQTIHVGAGVDRGQMVAAMQVTRKQTLADVTRLINGGAFSK